MLALWGTWAKTPLHLCTNQKHIESCCFSFFCRQPCKLSGWKWLSVLSKVSPALTRQAEEVEVWTIPGRGSQTSFTRSLWATLAARDWIISNFEFSLEWIPAFTERLKQNKLLHHSDVLRVCRQLWTDVKWSRCVRRCLYAYICMFQYD